MNTGYVASIMPLYPGGTNSTLFTEYCQVAICDNQKRCPSCEGKVIGWDEENKRNRHMTRWQYSYHK